LVLDRRPLDTSHPTLIPDGAAPRESHLRDGQTSPASSRSFRSTVGNKYTGVRRLNCFTLQPDILSPSSLIPPIPPWAFFPQCAEGTASLPYRRSFARHSPRRIQPHHPPHLTGSAYQIEASGRLCISYYFRRSYFLVFANLAQASAQSAGRRSLVIFFHVVQASLDHVVTASYTLPPPSTPSLDLRHPSESAYNKSHYLHSARDFLWDRYLLLPRQSSLETLVLFTVQFSPVKLPARIHTLASQSQYRSIVSLFASRVPSAHEYT
jgi:hypothetical protein